MKLRYFYRLDHNKQPIPGSNVRRKSIPSPRSQWKEILLPCCETVNIDCSCGPRYFVQLDGNNRPVDGTIIKRANGEMPEKTDGLKLLELQWKSVCCTKAVFSFNPVSPATGTFKMYVNGALKADLNSVTSVNVPIVAGDEIRIVLDDTTASPLHNVVVSYGGISNIFGYNGTLDVDHTFTYNGGADLGISAVEVGV